MSEQNNSIKFKYAVLRITLRSQTVLFGKCKRIPEQGRSLCSSFVIPFPLIVATNF